MTTAKTAKYTKTDYPEIEKELIAILDASPDGVKMPSKPEYKKYCSENDKTLRSSTFVAQVVGSWTKVGLHLGLKPNQSFRDANLKKAALEQIQEDNGRPNSIKQEYKKWFETHDELHIDFDFMAQMSGKKAYSWMHALDNSKAKGNLSQDGWRFQISQDQHLVTCVDRPAPALPEEKKPDLVEMFKQETTEERWRLFKEITKYIK